MTKKDLQKFYDAEKTAIENRVKAEGDFIEEHGLEIGTKVKVLRDWGNKGVVGAIAEAKIIDRMGEAEIRYKLLKATFSGRDQERSHILCLKRDEFEVIK